MTVTLYWKKKVNTEMLKSEDELIKITRKGIAVVVVAIS